MNLGEFFLLTDKALYYKQGGVEVTIIPSMNTVRASGSGFRCDASLADVAFHAGEKAVLTYQGADAGFTVSVPNEVARQIIAKRNEHMSLAQK